MDCGVGSTGTSCTVQPLGSCVPGYAPPANNPSSCTAAEISTFYTSCIAGGNCTGGGLSAACFACLASPISDSTWGAVLLYSVGSGLNIGGCYTLIGASPACAAATEEQGECEAASCYAACATATTAEIEACLTAADNGPCAPYVSAGSANCSAAVIDNPSCGAGATTYQLLYEALAKEFCL